MSLEEVVQTSDSSTVVQATDSIPPVQTPEPLRAVKALEARGISVTLPLTMVEEQLLELLFAAKGKIVSKAEIEAAIYSVETGRVQPASNCIEVFVGRLRRKLSHAEVIHTYRGRGYSLPVPMVEPEAACS